MITMTNIHKDSKGKKYKKGSLVRIQKEIYNKKLKPFRGHITGITDDGIIYVQPLNQDFDRPVIPKEISVIRYGPKKK